MQSKNNPLITVIIPIYKVEAYLDECVQSILKQTYSNLEIILVDDGSPDRCGEMCEIYAEKDARVKVIHQKNKGLSGARNSAIDIATGESLASKSLTYTSVFSKTICRLGKAHPDVVTICAAMPDGTGLTAFKKHFPGRFFDVGIAEQHAEHV